MATFMPPTNTEKTRGRRCIITTLPAEIKEHIYKYALLHPETPNLRVQVTRNGYSRPALLRTCKQIRSEALKIWYQNTKFHIHVRNFDATPLQRWAASFTSLGLFRSKIAMFCTPEWEPSWINLLNWLKMYHARVVHGRCPSPKHLLIQSQDHYIAPRWHVLGIMFDVAKSLRGMPWKEVEVILANMRPSLIAVDPRWRIDE